MKTGGRGRDKGDVFPVLPEQQIAADGKKLGYRWPKRHDGTPPPKAYAPYKTFPGTKQKQRSFLKGIVEGLGILEAAKAVPVGIGQHWYWINSDENYEQQYSQARQMLSEIAEDEFHRRGFRGFKRPVIYKGVITDWYTDYDTAAGHVWLKGAMPGKYRDSMVGLTSNAPVAIQINLGGEVKSNTDSDLSKLGDSPGEPNE